MTFDDYKQSLLDYLDKTRILEQTEIDAHQALTDEEKVEAGLLIQNAQVINCSSNGKCTLKIQENNTKWRPGEKIRFHGTKVNVNGECRVLENSLDSMVLTNMPIDSNSIELFDLSLQENEYTTQFYNVLKKIEKFETGSSFIEYLGELTPVKVKGISTITVNENDIPERINDAQRQAIMSILKRPSIYAIQGPPGTGKTDVLAILAKIFSEHGFEVLVLCNTHQAVNNALNKIIQTGAKSVIKVGDSFKSKDIENGISIFQTGQDYKSYRKQKAKQKNKYGDVVGATLCGGLIEFGIKSSAFSPSLILVDEASQISLAQASVIGKFGASCHVFIGDDRQMSPIFHTEMVGQELSISIFEHLQNILPDELKTTLTTTYRMNTPICRFVSDHYYKPFGIELKSYEGIATRHIENEDLSDSVEFINIDSTGCTDSNETEATKAVERAIHYKEMGENVAIVTPFRKQENLIREKWIASGQNLNGILIDTVERLQGIDVDVIIISTSVSDEDYFKQIDSFLLNRKRLNVMLSRAKKKVVIIKNSLISIYSYCGTDNMLYLSNKETKQDEMFVIPNEPKMVVENRQHILTQFGDLEFYEQGHRYLLNGKSLCSVSSIGHRFLSKPFDSKEQARKYALKHGETPEFWLNKWSCNSFKATTLGTKTHEFGESYGYFRNGHPEKILPQIKTQYNADLNYLAPIHPKEEAVVKFLEELPSAYHLVLNETKVYSGKNPDINKNLKEQICGTFDMLYYYDGDGDEEKAGFVVFDYKTNAHLMNEYNRSHNIKLREPFNSFYEEDLGLYTIQLSLYSLMLEDIGLKVIDRRLVWLKDDGSYETISLEDVSDKLRSIL